MREDAAGRERDGRLPPNVRRLAYTSLLNDVSSEMMFPLLPLFVTTVLGGGPAFLGLIEGMADAVASVTKLGAGALSDRVRRRKALVVGGYGVAAVARLLVAAATAPAHVLALRVTDRVGKGLRTAPRDALIAESIETSRAGRAFGYHRAMDHLGAALGPIAALVAMTVFGLGLRAVFVVAALPGLAAIAVLQLGVRERGRDPVPPPPPERRGGARPSAREFGTFLAIMALFTLGNSTDAFLLLRATDVGLPQAAAPLLWFVLHVVKSATATAGGAASDRRGRRRVIVAGWSVYALVYLGLGRAGAGWQVAVLFAAYGLYFGLTDGPLAAVVAEMTRGRAGIGFGLYHATIGLATLPASLLMGWLWERFGPAVAFDVGAALAGVAALALLVAPLPAAQGNRTSAR